MSVKYNKRSVSSRLFEANSPLRKYRNNNVKHVNSSLKMIDQEEDDDDYEVEVGGKLMVDCRNGVVEEAPFTKEMFYEAYSKGEENISVVECPINLQNISFFKAPESYDEINRLNYVEKYLNLTHWERCNRFNMLINKMTEMFKCKGASISLIDSRNQLIKFEVGYGFNLCSRQISIDSHCILSREFLLVLDCNKDWRFKNNPIVKDFPFIKFYLGVPLVNKEGYTIGVLSIFDSYVRSEIDEETIGIMKKMSGEIMEFLDSNVRVKSNYQKNPSNKMLMSTSLVSSKDSNGGKKNFDNIKKIFEIYGRATSNGKNSVNEIIFENDGSGNAYKFNEKIKFHKDSSIYEEGINLKIWNGISKVKNFDKACKIICENICREMGYDCVYIVNVKTNCRCWIKSDEINVREREVKLKDFHGSMEKESEVESRSRIMSSFSIGGDDSKKVNKDFYERGMQGNGIVFRGGTGKYKSGLCLPFYRYEPRLLRREKMKKIEERRVVEYFLKNNVYEVTCLRKEDVGVSEEEVGYVYGSVCILRKVYI